MVKVNNNYNSNIIKLLIAACLTLKYDIDIDVLGKNEILSTQVTTIKSSLDVSLQDLQVASFLQNTGGKK